ncbi:MAG: hypothetical protein LBG11_05365 [Bifidobacteriaceae bacterium]|jgi:alpha-tubulin suppressor-like RCC1 family protein|nr:hypothetical protein [Bifidobacteriaceae bacterium]
MGALAVALALAATSGTDLGLDPAHGIGTTNDSQARRLPQTRQPLAVPAVLNKPGGVEVESRKDFRSVDTGVGVFNSTAYIWGYAWDGISGDQYGEAELTAFPPAPVENLPQGIIIDVASGIYNFNALDVAGCVWGWGVYGWHDGSGNRYRSYPPIKIRIGGEAKDTSKPLLCNAQTISRTEKAGAAITTDGMVYSWGISGMGGPGPDNATNKVGAKLVSGLPDPSVEGNRPVALEGGYGTFWVILENGEVWYFGHDEFLAAYHHERPEGDENGKLSGGRTTAQVDAGQPQVAMPSQGLSPWFRANSPDEYIVQIHSGIAFGAALLSTGRVLSWGKTQHFGALGRQCNQGNTAQKEACARRPGLVDFGSRNPKIISISCAFTATGALAEDGVFYGWGKPERSYENLPDIRSVSHNPGHLGAAQLRQVSSFGGAGSVVEIASHVVSFQSGQGYFLWQLENGQYWGRGYNSKGQLGNKAGNYGVPGGFNETLQRAVWFTKSYYHNCWSVNQASPGYGNASKWPGDQILMGSGSSTYDWKSYACTDLNEKDAAGKWTRRFTLDECVAGKCGL